MTKSHGNYLCIDFKVRTNRSLCRYSLSCDLRVEIKIRRDTLCTRVPAYCALVGSEWNATDDDETEWVRSSKSSFRTHAVQKRKRPTTTNCRSGNLILLDCIRYYYDSNNKRVTVTHFLVIIPPHSFQLDSP